MWRCSCSNCSWVQTSRSGSCQPYRRVHLGVELRGEGAASWSSWSRYIGLRALLFHGLQQTCRKVPSQVRPLRPHNVQSGQTLAYGCSTSACCVIKFGTALSGGGRAQSLLVELWPSLDWHVRGMYDPASHAAAQHLNLQPLDSKPLTRKR